MTATNFCTRCGRKTTHVYDKLHGQDVLRCIVCLRTITVTLTRKDK